MLKNKLASISHGCSILDSAFRMIKTGLTPGITELRLKYKINAFLKKSGAEGFAFPGIVAFGNHTANIHHKPTARKLTLNQIVMIDIGVKINGWCSDATRMFFTGKPKQEWQKTYCLVLKGQKLALAALNSGTVPARLIDSIPRKLFPIPHAVGHGLDKIIHADPKINPRSRFLIKPGDIITIEPGRYFPGRFGVRIEDSVLKTKSGYRLLTKFPKSI